MAFDTTINLENTQCPACKATDLTCQLENISLQEIYSDAIHCHSCNRSYDLINGVPYIGNFHAEEVLSLLEIAANAGNSNLFLSRDEKDDTQISQKKQDFTFWIRLVEEYTYSSSKSTFFKDKEIEKPYWFENRYRQHLLFKSLTNDIEIDGKSVLDIGAGMGYDSLNFYACGANVTCLEFSPLLCAVGKYSYPQLRWFGGSSRNLPFANCQFDIVVANATLHHLLDLPNSLGECLRVLKPGGFLITMGDSFCSNQTTEEAEALIFNNHPAVLQGVNEQVPKFSDFVKTFDKFREYLDIRVFTSVVHNLSPYPREWTFEEALKVLSTAAGSLHFLVRKKSDFKVSEVPPNLGEINPAQYTKHLKNQTSGISWLVNFIPNNYLDLPLLDKKHPKFRLLNGWKIQKSGDLFRTGYKRARLFFSTKQGKEQQVCIALMVPYVSQYDEPTIHFSMNAQILSSQAVVRGIWYHFNISIPHEKMLECDVKEKFFLEISLHTKNITDEAKIFRVRRFELLDQCFTESLLLNKDLDYELEEFGIETLLSTVFKEQKSLTALVSPDYEHSMDTINRINQFSYKLKLIIPSEQRQFYSWLPNIEIISTYTHTQNIVDKFDDLSLVKAIELVISSKPEFEQSIQKNLQEKLVSCYLTRLNGLGEVFQISQHLNNVQAALEAENAKVHQATNVNETERIKNRFKRTHQRLQKLENRIAKAEKELALLKTSKFWKMRSLWCRFKQILGFKE